MKSQEYERLRGKISIIVPVYNVENVLQRCIKSIINQTYRDIEIILVNDGSTDKSGEICYKAANEDERIVVFEQINSGVSSARNLGLSKCTGEYITFIDADDYVKEEYCEVLLKAVLANDVDISCCYEIDKNCTESEEQVYQVANYSFIQMDAHYLSWGALYRKEIIKDIRFDTDLFVAEDTYFFAQALKKSKRFIHTHKKLYFYVIYDNSASHGSFDEKKYTEIESWRRICNLYQDMPQVWETSKAAYAIRCCAMLKKYYKNELFVDEYVKQLFNEYKMNLLFLLKYSKSLKECMSYVLFAIAPKVYINLHSNE